MDRPISHSQARKLGTSWFRGDRINGGKWPPTRIYARRVKARDAITRVDVGYDNSDDKFISLVKLWIGPDGEVTNLVDHRWKFEESWRHWTPAKENLESA